MSKPKFFAVFKAVAEAHVELDVDNWQDAAKQALAMDRPQLSKEGILECVGLIQAEDYGVYDAAHEVIGPCNHCGFMVLEGRCDPKACNAKHTGPGGYTTTEHGDTVWCSQACRDKDESK